MTIRLPKTYPNGVDTASNDNIVPQSAILAIECAKLFATTGPVRLRAVSHMRLAALNAAALARMAPDTVVIPLFAKAQDALGMVHTLESLGYRGRILVIGPALPNPDMVQDELRAAGPQGRLTLLSA